MREFTQFYDALDSTTKTNAKLTAMESYFRTAPADAAAWALFFLTGRRISRGITSTQLRQWASEEAKVPMWLLEECYTAVGDLSETFALLIPDDPKTSKIELPLVQLINERVLPLKRSSETRRREIVTTTWKQLSSRERFLYHKFLGGSFRVGVAKTLVIRALSQIADVPQAVMAHRLMGEWEPTAQFYQSLLAPSGGNEATANDPGKPYPFYLAYPLERKVEELGQIEEWQCEWKWDGIRAQLIRRGEQVLIWSRGEELMTDRFPEVLRAADVSLPDGTVLDGEILAWQEGKPLPFSELQRRIGRKKVDRAIQMQVPIIFKAYDLLEWQGQDVRERPLNERRKLLQDWHAGVKSERLLLSPLVPVTNWMDLEEAYTRSRKEAVEGIMLKRASSPYGSGRVKGDWWKWKTEPYHVDAVLIYAQGGSGRRASLFTDYTFAVWQGKELVPVAKAYSGLTNEEIKKVDKFIRSNTLEKFGPVHVVKPELVFQLAFEGIQQSTRHKAGVALRFPRMALWREDKKITDADTLETLQAMVQSKKVSPPSYAELPLFDGL